jgi:FKBP-type peptidyl-prolyl cis-trans isomerase 2
VRAGSRVRFDYALTVDGKPFESSSAPLDIVEGSGEVVPGLEEALMGMRPGESKRAIVPPEKGYGPIDPAKMKSMPASAFKDANGIPKPGMTVEGFENGAVASARVVSVAGGRVAMDFNPPLAGKTLDFEIRVLGVR